MKGVISHSNTLVVIWHIVMKINKCVLPKDTDVKVVFVSDIQKTRNITVTRNHHVHIAMKRLILHNISVKYSSQRKEPDLEGPRNTMVNF